MPKEPPDSEQAFDDALADLPPKQRRFVLEYLECLNASEAARRAKYATKANVQGARMLANASIDRAVRAGFALRGMPKSEVLARLAEHARADAEDFLTIERVKRRDTQVIHAPTEDNPDAVRFVEGPEYEVVEVRLDLEKAKARGKLHLLKEYKIDKDGAVTVKWHDSQNALIWYGKHHKLFTDVQEHTVSIALKGYTTKDASPDAWDDTTTE